MFSGLIHLFDLDQIYYILIVPLIFHGILILILYCVKLFFKQPVSSEGNSQSQNSLGNVPCRKNPGHEKFIAAKKIKRNDMPDGYRRRDLFHYVQTLSGVVVGIQVQSDSKNRPADLEVCKDVHRERDCRWGSGIIWNLQECEWRDDTPCPCVDCEVEGIPEPEWGKLCVRTANHVIYDNQEAKGCTVLLDFDDPGDAPGSISLTGHEVIRSSRECDTCEIAAITHDRQVYSRTVRGIETCYETKRAQSDFELLTVLQGGNFLTIIISHPHGREKHISFGWSKYRNVENNAGTGVDLVSYVYDTPTCPGSSGAPVLLVGVEFQTLFFPPHCGCLKKRGNRNYSGKGTEVNYTICRRGKQSPLLFILRTPTFNWRKKMASIWSLLKVKLRKSKSYILSRLRHQSRRKYRKPNKKIFHKLYESLMARKHKIKNQVNTDVSLPDRQTVISCPNFKKHSLFLSVKSLSINSLPCQFQDPDLLQAILCLSDLTGLLKLSDHQMTCFIVHHDFSRSFQKRCPCQECELSSRCVACEKLSSPCQSCQLSTGSNKTWVSFVARTSYNFLLSKNVRSAKCLISYDDMTNHSDVRNLHFCKVLKKDQQKNTCEILLVTHDEQTGVKIYDSLDTFLKLSKVLRARYKKSSHCLTAIPCHPHGISKCVYIESMSGRGVSKPGGPFADQACIGSLGAPKYNLKCKGLLTVECCTN